MDILEKLHIGDKVLERSVCVVCVRACVRGLYMCYTQVHVSTTAYSINYISNYMYILLSGLH